MDQDANHLNMLSIFYYVVAALAGIFSCIPFIHVVLGIAMISGAFEGTSGEAPPAFLGWIFILIGLSIILIGAIYTVLLVLTGRYLAKRRHYTFCIVMAGISCAFMPFGTVLGIFTIIVLSRPQVKALFGAAPHPQEA